MCQSDQSDTTVVALASVANLSAKAGPANPCLSCGACCAFYRVSFYWSESDCFEGGTVPEHMTTSITPHRLAMRGTTAANPRCIALQGEIGQSVYCSIHALRATTCQDFEASWTNGTHNPDCDRCRAAYALPPLPEPLPLAG